MSRAIILVAAVALLAAAAGCETGQNEVMAPIRLEMPTDNLQKEIGVSGFILGTFIMLNGYLVIIASCIILLVKETTFTKILDLARMAGPMLNPQASERPSRITALLLPLTDAATRVKAGYMGLLAGLVMAYIGAWIAL
ncbi:MAG TPA: hypothetical protein PLW83_04400 [Deltaproteobacteria bacterium]|nr:hypothetical protein [Deltaproteobacteria bacterium]